MTTILDVPGSNPFNPFSTPIQAFFASTVLSSALSPAPDETATHLVSAVTISFNPAHALWQLWDAFFTAVATSPTSHAPHLALLDALRAQPPTQPKNVPAELRSYTQADGKLHWSALPRFGATGTVTLSGGGDAYYIRFIVFSAALLKTTKGKGEVHPIWVFHMCREVLERKGNQFYQPKPHRTPSEQVWALDVRIAATWMRDGGQALWEADREELRRYWAAALDEKTEMWPREDGLTRERWRSWAERLRVLCAEEGILGEETRAVVAEAAEAVESILEENST